MPKKITIKEEVYNKLAKRKREDESFSDLFERLIEREDTATVLDSLRGSVELTRAEKEEILADIEDARSL
jgi:predicted CopG family antitoxin